MRSYPCLILCSGCFDGLHAGHVRYLTQAQALSPTERLYVAIAPDCYIRAEKGREPFWSQAERAETVLALGVVDCALPQEGETPAALIYQYHPRWFVKGQDWRNQLPAEVLKACQAVDCRIVYVDTPGRHVSEAHEQDDLALERFEALVLSQQPASQPWEPVTDYSFEARKQIEGQHPELIRDVFQPTRVLDVGCGPEAVLVRLLLDLGVEVAGIDKEHHDPMLRADISAGIVSGAWRADLVICREVLEHLTIRQIRQAVTNLCALSSRYVYVTTRFHLAPTHLLDVATSDDLDPTHISMLNQTFLRVLFVLEGFKRRADLEQRMDWQQKGRVLVYERAA